MLIDISANLFDVRHNLHTRVLPTSITPEMAQANYNLSLNKQRVETEQDWRLLLAVGE